jgi:hypothetical protein
MNKKDMFMFEDAMFIESVPDEEAGQQKWGGRHSLPLLFRSKTTKAPPKHRVGAGLVGPLRERP